LEYALFNYLKIIVYNLLWEDVGWKVVWWVNNERNIGYGVLGFGK